MREEEAHWGLKSKVSLFREFMSAKLRTGSTLEFGVHDAKRLGFVVVLIVVSVGYSNNR